jgi:nucleoside 2-deoxyribosyltransferase
MKIAICSSLDFLNKIKEIADQLTQRGFEVIIPQTAEMILNGEVTLKEILEEKKTGEISKRAVKQNSIRYYFERIQETDAILVLNFNKKGIKNYIGGNVFLEMGFAHVLSKKIFLLNEIPIMNYTDEIKAMGPTILNGDLNKIK